MVASGDLCPITSLCVLSLVSWLMAGNTFYSNTTCGWGNHHWQDPRRGEWKKTPSKWRSTAGWWERPPCRNTARSNEEVSWKQHQRKDLHWCAKASIQRSSARGWQSELPPPPPPPPLPPQPRLPFTFRADAPEYRRGAIWSGNLAVWPPSLVWLGGVPDEVLSYCSFTAFQ